MSFIENPGWSPDIIAAVFLGLPIAAYCAFNSAPQKIQERRHNSQKKRDARRNQRWNERQWKYLARKAAKR